MAISHSILASLIDERPCSGYDLAKQFKHRLGFFWKASHQQIYRELSKLEQDGLVLSEIVPQENRPDKKVYRVTESGKKYLVDWMMQPSEPSPIKEDLLVKLHVGHMVPVGVIIEELTRQRQTHRHTLELYLKWESKYFNDISALPLKGKFRYLNLRSGINHERAQLAWFDEAISFLSTEVRAGEHENSIEPEAQSGS